MNNEETNKVLEELQEEWRNISNYDGRYKVSSYGNVKNKKKVMSLYESHGYLGVYLSNGNGKTWHSVHRLVAEAFLDKKYFKCLPSEDRKQISNAGGFIWRYAKEFGGICNER